MCTSAGTSSSSTILCAELANPSHSCLEPFEFRLSSLLACIYFQSGSILCHFGIARVWFCTIRVLASLSSLFHPSREPPLTNALPQGPGFAHPPRITPQTLISGKPKWENRAYNKRHVPHDANTALPATASKIPPSPLLLILLPRPSPLTDFQMPRSSSHTSSKDPKLPVPYKRKQYAKLQARLNALLAPENLAYRAGPAGGQRAYLTGEKAMALANRVFGFNGWCSQIRKLVLDHVLIPPPPLPPSASSSLPC
jgi:hypothetical protein